MRKLIIILIFIAAQNIFGQSGWQWVNPLPSGNDLKVQFFNSKTGFGIGNCGTVVKTTNGGNNWFSVTSCGGSAFNLLDLCIINSDTVYITGYNDISWYPACLFKSTDSGKSWSIITNNLPFVYSGHTIFNDVNTGYIINGGNIYKTTNGGQNWVTKLSTSFTGKQIIFMNNQIGFASFNAYNPYRRMILKTSDSGANWDSVFVENSSAYINAMSFINISTGYVVAYPKLLKTTNSGISWDSIAPSPQVFSSMSFINNETGYTTGSNVILKTTNMGITWNAKSVIGNLSYISVPSSDTCFASGEGGAIYRTTNAGVNWNCTSTQNPELKVLKDIYFINEQTGFICGYNGAFLKSTNGGVNWQVSKINNKDFFSVYFIDALTGFLGYQTVTSSSYLCRTTNSGQSWDSTSVLGSVFDFYFLNNSTGFYSNAERVYKTTNSGLNWSPTQYTGGGSSMLSGSIQFLNQTTGYFFKMNLGGGPVPSSSMIYKTTDGGNNWIAIYIASGISLRSLKFINETTGFAKNNGYDIRKTTDGGISWSSSLFNNQYDDYECKIESVKPNILYCGRYKTTNLGLNWILYNVPTYYLWELTFMNENTGIAVGGLSGGILRTTDGGAIISKINLASYNIPEQFSLSQNYPNPFNPSTVIRYQLSVAGFTTLKVFDLLGKEVATLLNEKQSAGSYAVDFNSTEYSLPSGIYFYTLSAGEFKETRKMVLIK